MAGAGAQVGGARAGPELGRGERRVDRRRRVGRPVNVGIGERRVIPIKHRRMVLCREPGQRPSSPGSPGPARRVPPPKPLRERRSRRPTVQEDPLASLQAQDSRATGVADWPGTGPTIVYRGAARIL